MGWQAPVVFYDLVMSQTARTEAAYLYLASFKSVPRPRILAKKKET